MILFLETLKRAVGCAIAVALLLAFPGESLSVDGVAVEQSGEPEREGIRTLQRELEKRDRIIEDLRQRLEALEKEVNTLGGKQVSQETPRPQPPPKDATPPPATREETEAEERLAQATLERVLIQRSSVLLSPWTFEIEPSLSYAHSSADKISIDGVAILDVFGIGLVVGEIVSERVRRDTLVPALTFRLGLPWESQVETRIPYRYESESVTTVDFAERSRSNSGLGDAELAFSRQFVHEKGWLPDIVGGIRWRIPTGRVPSDGLPMGTDFHGLQFQVSAVKIRDPVAFFGGLNYTVNFPDSRRGRNIDPGDAWGFNLGLALALNPETSINFQWDHRFTNHTDLDGENVPGTNFTVGIVRLGLTYALTRNVFLDMGVGMGLTRDAPDVVSTIALPVRF